jgi:C_GCAxxG_C_C family probable redox protein
MKEIKEQVITSFRSGLNCAQAVLSAYSERLNFDREFAIHVARGFGGGMGRLQETCGAVTGAYMVLGILSEQIPDEESVKKEETYAMIQEFEEKFVKIHGTTNCRKLTGHDLRTTEGRKKAKEDGVFERICEKCVAGSIEILEGMVGAL